MALLPGGRRALREYLARTKSSGELKKQTIARAVQLTQVQQAELQAVLQKLWSNVACTCPYHLDIRPKHGYESRVIKDSYTAEQYGDWLELACSDLAVVGTDSNGRPRLCFGPNTDFPNYTYTLVAPVTSDALCNVHISDVIPSGLPPGTTKPPASGAETK